MRSRTAALSVGIINPIHAKKQPRSVAATARQFQPHILAACPVEVAEVKAFATHQPVVGYQHAGDRAESARIADQPGENVTGRICEQSPRLHQNSDYSGDQSAGAE